MGGGGGALIRQRWLGRRSYRELHALQQRCVQEVSQGAPDVILLLEHPPVYTLGRGWAGDANDVDSAGLDVVPVERGGGLTWHGPGQLVAYPIVALRGARRDLPDHLRRIESGVISLLAELGLEGLRDRRNTGVWLGCEDGQRRKVCAIGVAVRRWVSWHGLALNIHPDLAAFQRVRPCGLDPALTTRLADHLPGCPEVSALAPRLGAALSVALG